MNSVQTLKDYSPLTATLTLTLNHGFRPNTEGLQPSDCNSNPNPNHELRPNTEGLPNNDRLLADQRPPSCTFQRNHR